MNNIIPTAFLVCWIFIGLYIGTSGIVYSELAEKEAQLHLVSPTGKKFHYNGQEFSSKEAIQIHIEYQRIFLLYPWIDNITDRIALILSSCALGALGGVIRILRQIAFKDGISVSQTNFISVPALGALLGMVVLGLSYIVPSVLTTDSNFELRDSTLMFLCLFSGIFSKRFMEYLDERFTQKLNTISEAT